MTTQMHQTQLNSINLFSTSHGRPAMTKVNTELAKGQFKPILTHQYEQRPAKGTCNSIRNLDTAQRWQSKSTPLPYSQSIL